MSNSFEAKIKKSILKIMRENLGVVLKLSNKEIELNIRQNAVIINMCIDEYIEEFGEEEGEEVNEEWLEEYMAEYFE